jgi:uncharacterized protein
VIELVLPDRPTHRMILLYFKGRLFYTLFLILMSQIRIFLQKICLICVVVVTAWQICLLPAAATALYEIPTISRGVPTWSIDKAGVLSVSTKAKVNSSLEKLAATTGKEVRFLTIHRFDYGDNAQTFTAKIFQKWFPTAEEQNNQMLIVLDDLTNTTGVMTGASVKEVLSDEVANSIANETMLVPLRSGNKYNQSFSDAVDRVTAVLSGQPDPGPPVIKEEAVAGSTYLTAEETEANRFSFTTVVIVLLIAATVIPMATWWWYQNQD